MAKDDNVMVAVEHLLRRRHQIAHTADYGQNTELQEIKQEQVVDWLKGLEELVNCIDNILENKFRLAATCAVGANNFVSLSDKSAAEFSAAFHRAKGYIDAKELSSLRRIADIEALFGVKVKRRGFLCAGAVEYPLMDNTEIWWPKIAPEPNYAGWINEPNHDEVREIVEIHEHNVAKPDLNARTVSELCEKNIRRIVLAVVDGDSSVVGYCYRFLGIFALDIEASKKKNVCVWKRKESRMEIKR